jgi:hypothetical protein
MQDFTVNEMKVNTYITNWPKFPNIRLPETITLLP